MTIEIARVTKGRNNMETAKAFAQCEAFRLYRLGEIVETMRSYSRDGLLVYTDREAILYHEA